MPQINRLIFSSCLLIAFALSGDVSVAAKPNSYALQPVLRGEEPVVLRVYNTQSHQVVWTRKAGGGLGCYAWSHDHRALAVEWGAQNPGEPQGHERFTIWRAGQKPRTFVHLPEPMGQYGELASLYTESLVKIVWSPNKRRFLILAGGNLGSASEGMGNLWCVNAKTFTAKLVVASEVTNPAWISSHRVSYTECFSFRQELWVHKKVNL